jgi:hypothetical protein
MKLHFDPPNEVLSSELEADLAKYIVEALTEAGKSPGDLDETMRVRSFLTSEQVNGLKEGTGFGANRKRLLKILASEVVGVVLSKDPGEAALKFPSPNDDKLHSARELAALDPETLGKWVQNYTWAHFSLVLADPNLKAKFGQYLNICQERMRDMLRGILGVVPTGEPKALGDDKGSAGVSKKHSDKPDKPLKEAAKDMIRGRLDLAYTQPIQIHLVNLRDKLENEYRSTTVKGEFLPSNPAPDSNMNLDVNVAMLREATTAEASKKAMEKAWKARLLAHYRGRFNFKGIQDPTGIQFELQIGAGNISGFYDEVNLPTGKGEDTLHVHDAAYKGADKVMSIILDNKPQEGHYTAADLATAKTKYMEWATIYEDAQEQIIRHFQDQRVEGAEILTAKDQAELPKVKELQAATKAFFKNPSVVKIVAASEGRFEEQIYKHLPVTT